MRSGRETESRPDAGSGGGADIKQAMACHHDGDLAGAEALYRKFLHKRPGHPDATHLLGVVAFQKGQPEEAIALVGEAIALDPDQPFYHNTLGEIFRTNGTLGKAEKEYRIALKLMPDYPQALGNLGMVLHAGGDSQDAIGLFERALAIEPGNSDLHNNLGVAKQSTGELREAIRSFKRAMELMPRHAEACHNLAVALKEQGRLVEARETAEHCVRLAPTSVQAAGNLVDIYVELGWFAAAEPVCRRAIELDSGDYKLHHAMARILRELGRLDEAIGHNRKALDIDPSAVEAYNDLGVSLLATGDFEGARCALLRGLELAPEYALLYENLSRTKRFGESDRETVEDIKALAACFDSDNSGRIGLDFALGKIHDDLGEYEAAFDHYEQANRLKREGFTYDPDAQDDWTSRLRQIFDSELVGRLTRYGNESSKPIFIVGMPRSGTSLVEQILASHPLVYGAGELLHFYEFTQSLAARLPGNGDYPECATAIGEPELRWMAESYLMAIKPLAPAGFHVVDKMSMNFFHLGLLASTFPRAKLIVCEREVRDVCLSIYFQIFARKNLFAYDLYEIGRFYRQYEWMMTHWTELLGQRLFRVCYETLVEDPESLCKDLLAACGLPWDERCLRFHRTERAVHTASAWQVRQPIHSSSVERWRHYENHLSRLEAGLAGLPRPA